MRWLVFVFLLLQAPICQARGTIVNVTDASGAPFKDVLMIVRRFDPFKELGRHSTDVDGNTPGIGLPVGLSQIIATCPYGPCSTTVREVKGERVPPVYPLSVPLRSTDELGELVGVRMALISVEPPPGGRYLGHVNLLARDSQAIREEGYTTDDTGLAKVRLIGDPPVPRSEPARCNFRHRR